METEAPTRRELGAQIILLCIFLECAGVEWLLFLGLHWGVMLVKQRRKYIFTVATHKPPTPLQTSQTRSPCFVKRTPTYTPSNEHFVDATKEDKAVCRETNDEFVYLMGWSIFAQQAFGFCSGCGGFSGVISKLEGGERFVHKPFKERVGLCLWPS